MLVRPLDKGMGEAVARRTVYRPSDEGSWANVAKRVALGNTLLGHPQTMQVEAEAMTEAIASGSLLMSGRHLQHGDDQQPRRAIEVFTNCSSAAASFAKFYLLLNGSGVGRSYDDHMMVVDWQKGPNIRLGLSIEHVDFPKTPQALQDLAMSWGMDQSNVDSFAVSLNVNHLTVLDAISRGIEEDDDFVYLQVADSREGWAHALERWETMAFLKDRRTLIIDWTPVRHKGAPIGGMQDRPASGPLSPMRAFWRVFNQVVLAPPMALWRQAMVVDHFMSEEVQVGGARRAARMSTKDWHDSDIIDFIEIKSKGGLWTSNNSITVDAEFWKLVAEGDARAKEIFDAATACSFINGEPGFINGDLLEAHGERQVYDDGSDFRSDRFQAKFGQSLLKALGERARTCRFQYITNPCVTGDTWVTTAEGQRQVKDLIGKPFSAIVNGEVYASDKGFWKTGTRQVYKIKTDRGYTVRATDNHKFLTGDDAWVEVIDLECGDSLRLCLGSSEKVLENDPAFEAGWLMGEVVGDGGVSTPSGHPAYVRFWGETAKEMAEYAAGVVNRLVSDRAQHALCEENRESSSGIFTVGSRKISDLASRYLGERKSISTALESESRSFVAGFLRGFFDADGSIQGNRWKGISIRLSQSDLSRLEAVQRMLMSFGIVSSIYRDRKTAGIKLMPDGKGGMKEYPHESFHELVISRTSAYRFMEVIGLREPKKVQAWAELTADAIRKPYRDSLTSTIVSIEKDGIEDVYDCTIEGIHAFSANGLMAHNCGEIVLHVLGAYCVIADVAPVFAFPGSLEEAIAVRQAMNLGSDDEQTHAKIREWDDNFHKAAKIATRALMRVNKMPALYQKEVERTQRIGVGLTGVHEYAWLRFGLTFDDMLSDKPEAAQFWAMLNHVSEAIKAESIVYAKELGVDPPHTVTTMKPSGTTSKLFGLTEGAHLPSMASYLRWVQFQGRKTETGEWAKASDPQLPVFEAKGYPMRQLKEYAGTTIVGFPTIPLISRLGMPKVVTAPEATPDQQYQYLRLMEENWIGKHRGNQVSYTLKIFTDKVSLEEYRDIVLRNQPTIRCCSVMPTKPDSQMGYEYLPEQAVTLDELAKIMAKIKDDDLKQEIDINTLLCASGACPM